MAMSTGKKIAIGCGGCLGLIVLLIALAVGSIFFLNETVSKPAVESIVGKTVPSGYTALGMPLSDTPPPAGKNGLSRMGVFMNVTNPLDSLMVMVLESQLTAVTRNELYSADIAIVNSGVATLLKDLGETDPNTKMHPDNLQIQNIETVTLPNTRKQYRAIHVKLQMDKGDSQPGVVALVESLAKPGKTFILYASDPGMQPTAEARDFRPDYQQIQHKLNKLIDATDLGR